MLDLAILGLLEEHELHGYEIRRQLRQHLGLLANVSFGSLYPALARLQAAGAVEATEPVASAPQARPTAPPTGSLSGELAVLRARRHSTPRTSGRRSRKVYRITDVGRRMFAELLAGGGPDDARTFGLRVSFARHLAPHARLSLLERRRAVLSERLAEVSRMAGAADLDVYARSVVEHTTESVDRDIRWIDRLIEVERNTQEEAARELETAGAANPAAVGVGSVGGGSSVGSTSRAGSTGSTTSGRASRASRTSRSSTSKSSTSRTRKAGNTATSNRRDKETHR